MKVSKYNLNRNKSQNKSQNKKITNKNIKTNQSISSINRNYPKKNKSKNKSIGNSIKLKSKSKQKNLNELLKSDSKDYNLYNNKYDNFIENYNNNHIITENQKVNNDLNINNSFTSDFISSNQNSKNNLNNLYNKQYIKNEYIENSNIFKKTLDRLLMNSNNLLEKQNNILYECDILSKNVAMNDYAIQSINNNENKINYQNLIEDYTRDITSILSTIKKNKTNSKINEELKKENNLLKNELEMLNIDKEDNLKFKDGEINTLKIVLISEINHILNFLNEIGYDNIPINKMEISDLTKQSITNFFELIIKIIKQMKELIQKKESLISKMIIEQNTLRDYQNENNINKSYEKLSFDYNSYNSRLKNYNISVQNSNQKSKYNISFRNYGNSRNSRNDNEFKTDLNNENNNFKNNINELLSINNKENNKEYINNCDFNNNKLIEEMNTDKIKNSDSHLFFGEKHGDNYSYDRDNNFDYQTGSFILKQTNCKKIEEDEIIPNDK
jgi:hypothetical protein